MDQNLRTFNQPDVVSWYDQRAGLLPAEASVLDRYRQLVSEAHVLDIGIGGGRTTSYLVDNCRTYTGIDYSEELVKSCRKKFPGVDISCRDARNLFEMRDGIFDFVLFSFNGIDYVDLEGRDRILSEVQRVLKNDGIFFFSTHNRNHPSFNKAPWRRSTSGLVSSVKSTIKVTPFYFRRIKSRKREVVHRDYAIVNDFAHQYRLLTFYTSPGFLKEQLLARQFVDIVFYDKSGDEKLDEELDDWIFVTCRKAPCDGSGSGAANVLAAATDNVPRPTSS
jgi:SAM-dependent methyltransferase